MSDLADCPQAAQTSPNRYTPRYLTTEILFTRIDIADHADSTGCNGNKQRQQQRQRDIRSSFVVRKQFTERFASRVIDRVEQRCVILVGDDVRNDL